MNRDMRASLTVTADASAVVTALRQGSEGLRDFRRTGEASAAAISESAKVQTAAMDSMASAAARAVLSQDELAKSERRLIDQRQKASSNERGLTAVASSPLDTAVQQVFSAELRTAETAADSMRRVVSGMSISLEDAVDDMMLATVEAREYAGALDEVRRAISPLYAESKRYEETLDAIGRAERINAINAGEAATARQRAASFIAPSIPSGDPLAATGNVYAAAAREQAEQVARAYRSIEESLNPLIRAERELAEAQEVVNRTLAAGLTTNTSAARTIDQLQARYQSFVRAHSPAAQSARAFETAIEAEADAMRRLTLAVDPAARKQEEFARVQAQVTRAVQMDIVTKEEATRVMALFEASQKKGGFGTASLGSSIQNTSYQIADFAVQVQAGQAASLALAQQLPQLLGGWGMYGAVLGAVVAVGAPLVTMWLKSGDAAGSLDDRLTKLEATLTSVGERLKLLNDARLNETFGNMTGDIRSMTSALLALERAAELKQLGAAMDGILGRSVDLSWWQKLERPMWGEGRQEYTDLVQSWNYADLTGGRGPSYDEYQSRRDEINALAKAGEVERVVSEVERLVRDFADGGPLTDLNADLLKSLKELGTTAKDVAEAEALFNGTGRAEAIKREIDELERGFRQQAELSKAVAIHGADAAEVEAVRNRHARENLDIQLRSMGVAQGSAEEARARAALEADIAASAEMQAAQRKKDQDALFADLSRQSELSAAILAHGRDSAEVEAVRARHAKEINDERLKEMGLFGQLLKLAQELFSVEQKRTQEIKDQEEARKADDMLADLREEAAINAAIAVHGRDSLVVKELQIAAARREYEESLKSLGVSEERKKQLMEEWELARGRGAADPFGQIAAGRELVRNQQDRLTQLRLELALLGQTETTRTRILALWRAEQDIRRAGIDAGGARASELRAAALEEAELTRSLERQRDAWAGVENAAASTIDGIVGKLTGGDIEGALEALAQNIGGMLTELSITNPLKNAILGSDLATMQDVGGLKGIWGRLTGKGDKSDVTVPDSLTSLANMDVQAANVVIGGPGVMSLLAGMPGAANIASAPGSFSGLGGSDEVQSQVWSFFAGKGLKPHQIAAMMGQVSAESSFNPQAVGDNGTSFGLFQHHAGRGQGLLNAVGGKAGLGNVNGQLEYAWRELMTSENGVLQRLMASTNVRDATIAAVGFERPQGWSAANPTGAHNFDGRLAAAEASLGKFGSATETATADLGTLGGGMGAFGSALKGFAQGGPEGALNGLLGALGTAVATSLKIPGFAGGGRHRGGLRIVGEQGPELEYTGASTILPADLTRQLMEARQPVVAANQDATPVLFQPRIQVVNQSSAPVAGEIEESTDARGQRQYRLVLSDMAADGLSVSGGRASQAMRSKYGIGPTTRRRG